MADEGDPLAGKINLALVTSRLAMMNDCGNQLVQEISQTGRARVAVEKAFSQPDDLAKLLARIGVLTAYAEAAARIHGQPMGDAHWLDLLKMFRGGMHVLPTGKLS